MTTTTRFAPSPTGYLHVGSVRTALYCWLYAKHQKGRFILRIEDTDKERSTNENVNVILEGMRWLGLDWDEGPVYQTKRFERYKEVIEELKAKNAVYPCFCSKERLEALREEQMAKKIKPRYDGCCRHLTPEEQDLNQPHVIRFRQPSEGEVIINDTVRGQVTVDNGELDDLILVRSDGTPTYNFCVVVDDADMGVTHVIRGEDHISNTPRQINVLQALGKEPPAYAHIPMILGDDGKKLSKRHGAVSVLQYKEEGFLPQALLNYLVRLGWSYGDQEIFTLDEMIEYFDLVDVNKAASAFNTEKLLWLNQHYIKTLPVDEVAKAFAWQCDFQGLSTEDGPELTEVVSALCERATTLKEMVEMARYFYEPITIDEKAGQKHLKAVVKPALEAFTEALGQLKDYRAETIHQLINEIAERFELKMGKIAQPIRVAVTGNTMSPSIDLTLLLIGQKRATERLQAALKGIDDN